MRARLLVSALWALFTLHAVPALAQQDHEAHGLFDAGAAAFQSGRYDDALGYFQRAYELSHRAQLLFNIGQAADRARHDEVALRAFREYLAAEPDVANRAEIEGRIRVLEQAVAQAHASGAQSTTTTASSDAPTSTASSTTTSSNGATPDDGLDVPGLVLIVSGGVVGVAGAIMLGVGVPGLGPVREGETFAETSSRQSTAESLTIAGSVALGLGVVAAVIGAVLLATHGSASHASALRLTPGGLTLSF